MTVTVHVVTPCRNAVDTIDRTIASVLSQAGDFCLHYHIQDGGSTDGTLERIQEWDARFASGAVVSFCHDISFTYASAPDRGMYDALVTGFAAMDARYHEFMTWINADDLLMPGAVALAASLQQQFQPADLSWFGGAVCILRDDMINRTFDRPIPQEALKRGLCDGQNWDYLQQEGTFFRNWLWKSVEPADRIGSMKLAGDWNLWRLMAQRARFTQATVPLGGLRISEGQMSASQRNAYRAEIASVIPDDMRRQSFLDFCAGAPIERRRLKPHSESILSIVNESAEGFARHRFQTVMGAAPRWNKPKLESEELVAIGKAFTSTAVGTGGYGLPKMDHALISAPGLVAFDDGWQFPAITEQHAFRRMMQSMNASTRDVIYVAYPWATLIDKIDRKTSDLRQHLSRFDEFCASLPQDAVKITVCQHIFGRRYVELFQRAGISHVFWSHATADDLPEKPDPVRFHPFPLYPVQVPEALPEAGPDNDEVPRKHLFSFVGARANQYYLTQSRNWILDYLSQNPRGAVTGRDGWHYQKVVYDHQVRANATTSDVATLVDVSASEQFRQTLTDTTFALCPSGSGPNSIRLWESIGAGAIPVILADSWAPPGDRRLWEMAAVFCEETPEAIRALPDQLAEIAADPAQLASMRQAMRQLWLLYGPQSFVTDVQEFMQSCTGMTSSTSALSLDGLAEAAQRGDGAALLRRTSACLLLDPVGTLAFIDGNDRTGQALQRAKSNKSINTSLRTHYTAVLAHARNATPPASPMVQRGAVPALCFLGRHAHRTPLSYQPIRRLLSDAWHEVADPSKADVIITGFNIDLRENADTLAPLMQRLRPPRLLVLSEEPLWDITWSGPFTGRHAQVKLKSVSADYVFAGHETSDAFAFERIPYFVLTSDSYAARYANLMGRFADVTADQMLTRWREAAVPAAYYMEKREGEAYAKAFLDRDVVGLSGYRTEVAKYCMAPGTVRVGKGWSSEARRQDLPDWHMDKLARLDGRTRLLSAFENVHQRHYISEKIFDAFAVGALPAYWASPDHRVHELVEPGAMVNCHELSAQDAAARIAAFEPDIEVAKAWLSTCVRLAGLFGDLGALAAERRRVAQAALAEVQALA